MYYKSLIDIHIFVLGNVPLLAIVFQFQLPMVVWDLKYGQRTEVLSLCLRCRLMDSKQVLLGLW